MDDNNYRYQFSKMLIESAINVIEEIDFVEDEAEQIKLLGLYSSIAQSMEFVIERYITEKDQTTRQLFIDDMRAKLSSIQVERLDEVLEDSELLFSYKGKDYPKA